MALSGTPFPKMSDIDFCNAPKDQSNDAEFVKSTSKPAAPQFSLSG